MKIIKLHRLLVLIAALALVSCSATYKGFPDRVVTPETELDSLKKYFSAEMINAYDANNIESERRRVRDQIINGRLAAIDIQFSVFQKNLREEGLNLNIGADIVTLGLSAAGGLVTGGSSQILSATSAAVIGTKASVDKHAFYEETMPALFAQMIAQRKIVLVKIRRGLNRSTADYPLQQGIAELVDYQYAGSIPGSIANIVESAGVISSKATEDLDEILVFNMDKGASNLEEFLGTIDPVSGTFDQVKIDMIKTCWRNPDVLVDANTKFSDFMFDASFKNQRVKTFECVRKF